MKDIREFEPLFGSWLVEELIGEGSFGKVYAVYRNTTGERETAAIKHISIPASEAAYRNMKIELNTDNDLYIRANLESKKDGVLAEYNLQRRFRGYTNFVDCQDIEIIPKDGDIPGYDIFIRMEKLTNLAEAMIGTRMQPKEAAKLGIDICRALELLKKESLVHRDLKPQNIFVTANGDYKIGDFGIARELSSGSMLMSVVGTSGYMAPEIAKGENSGFEADIYSLGIVLYKQLSGYAPFVNTANPASSSQITKAEISRLTGERIPEIPGIPDELNRIVLKACEFDKANRFKSPTEMRLQLERFLSEDEEKEKKQEIKPLETPKPAQNETPEPKNEPVNEPAATVRRAQPVTNHEANQTVGQDKARPERQQAPKQNEPPTATPKRKLKTSVLVSALLCLALVGVIAYMLLKPTQLTNDMIKLSFSSAVYTGGTLKPAVTLEANGKQLAEGKDYALTLPRSVNAGKYEVSVTGTGRYSGTLTAEYEIQSKSIAADDVVIEYNQSDLTYTGAPVEMDVTEIRYGSHTLSPSKDYTISGVTAATDVNEKGYELVITGKGNYSGTVTKQWNVEAQPLTGAEFVFGEALTYNGSAQTVSFAVSKDGAELEEGKDYTVQDGSGATAAGTYSLRLKGIGNYSGTCEAKWTIQRKDISGANIMTGGELTYTGNVQTLNIIRVMLGEDELSKGTNGYRISNNSDMATDAGSYTVTIYGTGNYTGTASAQYTIYPKNLKNGITIQLASSPTFSGEVETQSIKSVTFGDKELVEGTDYEIVSGDKATEISKTGYELEISGLGNYTGQKTATWNILPGKVVLTADMAKLSFTEAEWTGNALNPKVALTYEGITLTEGEDYTIEEPDSVDVGSYSVTVSGKGNYLGTVTMDYAIVPKDLSGKDIVIKYKTSGLTYTGQPVDMDIESIRYGTLMLKAGTDYTIGGVSSATDVNESGYELIIEGHGNYCGTVKKIWNVETQPLAGADIAFDTSLTYNGGAQTASFTVKKNGVDLTEGVDFTVEQGNSATNAGEYVLRLKGIGNYSGYCEGKWSINRKDISGANIMTGNTLTYTGNTQTISILRVTMGEDELSKGSNGYRISNNSDMALEAGEYTLTIYGTGNYTGTASARFAIQPRNIKNSADIQLDSLPVYNGAAQTVKIKAVYYGDTLLTEGKDYAIASGNGARDVGEKDYTLEIKGQGNYTGTKSVTWNIQPASIDDVEISIVGCELLGDVTAEEVESTDEVVETAYAEYEGEPICNLRFAAHIGSNQLPETDYSVTLADEIILLDWETGTYIVNITVEGEGNCKGTRSEQIIYSANRVLCKICKSYYNAEYDAYCGGCGSKID